MSSAVFEVKLRPDPFLRRLVFLSGSLGLVVGLIIIVQLALAPAWRLIIALVWFADCVRELRNLAIGADRVRQLRLDSDGRIESIAPGGRSERLVLMTGSVVWQRMAWLRLRFPDGSHYAELICGNSATNEAWHRFQLLWQQSRAAFGDRK